MKKFINGFKYAINGIIESFKSELNLKIHFFIMFFVILLGICFKITRTEWYICIILFSIVISGEVFNTAIENIVNIISPEKNEIARKIKDASAGGVLVLAIGAFVIGIMIFVPKIMLIF